MIGRASGERCVGSIIYFLLDSPLSSHVKLKVSTNLELTQQGVLSNIQDLTIVTTNQGIRRAYYIDLDEIYTALTKDLHNQAKLSGEITLKGRTAPTKVYSI